MEFLFRRTSSSFTWKAEKNVRINLLKPSRPSNGISFPSQNLKKLAFWMMKIQLRASSNVMQSKHLFLLFFQDNLIDSCTWPGSQMEHIWSGILGRFVDCNFCKAWIYKQLIRGRLGVGGAKSRFSFKLNRWLKSRWVAQKALRWNVLFLVDAHAVLFALALLSGSFCKRSG